MIRITTLAALLISTLASLNAHAELIQVEITVYQAALRTNLTTKMIFDTSAPPATISPTGILFHPVTSGVWAKDTPMDQTPDLDPNNPVIHNAGVQYSIDNTDLIFFLNTNSYHFSLTITNMPAPFNSAMDSLPNDPADWTPDPTTSVYWGHADVSVEFVFWDPADNNTFSGGFLSYSVEVLPEPSDACSPADLNEDGELDFFDVSEFLQIFGLGCP